MDYLLLGKVVVALGVYPLYCCTVYWGGLYLLGVDFTIIIFIRRKIPYGARLKWARVARRILQVIFTYYRLSRMLLLLGCHKLRTMIMISCKIRKHALIERRAVVLLPFPEDVMLLILRRLRIRDYLGCRAVCRSWRATIDMEIACKPGGVSISIAPQLPWLMLSPHPFSAEDHCFFSLSDWKTYRLYSNNNRMNRLDCVGSIEGWLFMVDTALWRPEGFMKPWSFYLNDHHSFDTAYFLLNPITGARVVLPSTPQSTFPCGCRNRPGFALAKLTASSTPTSSSQNCFFVASLCSKGHLGICRPTDRSWTCIKPSIHDETYYLDIEIMDGKLYATTVSHFVMVLDIQLGPPSYGAERLFTLHPQPIPSDRHAYGWTAVESMYQTYDGEVIYLAKDSTTMDLFMIYCRLQFAREIDPTIPWNVIVGGTNCLLLKTKGFRVFKLEHAQWVEVSDLGDRILFVSRSGSKFISATSDALNYNPNGDQHLEKNSIYYALDYFCIESSCSGHEFGVFSLTNKSLKRFAWPIPKTGLVKLNSRPVWFTPNL